MPESFSVDNSLSESLIVAELDEATDAVLGRLAWPFTSFVLFAVGVVGVAVPPFDAPVIVSKLDGVIGVDGAAHVCTALLFWSSNSLSGWSSLLRPHSRSNFTPCNILYRLNSSAELSISWIGTRFFLPLAECWW